jgi:hypothetical protein
MTTEDGKFEMFFQVFLRTHELDEMISCSTFQLLEIDIFEDLFEKIRNFAFWK